MNTVVSARGSIPSLGLVVLFFICAAWILFGPYSLYTSPSYIDPWIPLGYGTNFSELIKQYGVPYYVSRLPWIVPVLIFHSIFNVTVAIVLVSFLKLFACTGLLFLLVSKKYGTQVGLISSLLLLLNPYFCGAIYWYYPDGASITYLFIGYWLLFKETGTISESTRYFLVGFFFALAGYTVLISGLAILAPILVILYTRYHCRWKESLRVLLYILGGVIGATLLFGIIGKFLFNMFWFFWPQVKQSIWSLSDNNIAHYYKDTQVWVPVAYRLAVFIVPLVVGTLFLLTRKNEKEERSFLKEALITGGLSFFLFLYFQFIKKGLVLETYYHSSFLLVPISILIGAIIGTYVKKYSNSFITLWASFFICFFIILAHKYGWISFSGMSFINFPIYIGCSLFLLFLIYLIPLLNKFFIPALMSTIFLSLIQDQSLQGPFHNYEDQFEMTMRLYNTLKSTDLSDRHYRFWYEPTDENQPIMNAFNSLYLWGYIDITKDLSKLTQANFDYSIRDNTTFILLSSVPIDFVEKLKFLEKNGIIGRKEGEWVIKYNKNAIYMGLIHVELKKYIKKYDLAKEK